MHKTDGTKIMIMTAMIMQL